MRTLSCGLYTIDLFPAVNSQNMVYAVMDRAEAQAVWSMLKEPKPALAAISGVDWNRELSPWPAPKVFRGNEDFGGEGSFFLDILTGQIVPLVEAQLGFVPVSRAIAGYRWRGCSRCGPYFKRTYLTEPPPFPDRCGLTDLWTV